MTITSLAPISYNQFISIGNGAEVKNHGYNQCVALANLYHEAVMGGSFVAVPSAYQWWTNFDLWGTLRTLYYRVPADQNPLKGDIFVARGGIYNQPDGHIGVVTRSWDGRTFGTMEQNTGTGQRRYVYRYDRTKQNILGYLRPYKNPSDEPTPAQRIGDDMRVIRHPNGTIATVGEFGIVEHTDGNVAGAEAKAYGGTIEMSDAEYVRVKQQAQARRAQLIKDIAAQIPATTVNHTGGVDYAALAKAVNDDAAKRMKD
jgi:hypothetical protein